MTEKRSSTLDKHFRGPPPSHWPGGLHTAYTGKSGTGRTSIRLKVFTENG
jgi:hypothetical protein